MAYDIRFKRIYQDASPADGARVLVDRLWPRGKQKDELALDDWYKEASPSTGLRQCWHRGELTEAAFGHAYRHQLDQAPDCLLPLMRAARQGRLTLLTASKKPDQSHLPILRRALLDALRTEDAADRDESTSPTCYGS
ncbi:DUF488 domain-containing protein [Gilvimarinus sp. 1_MG-2023]|uniref:DUF488 domain-containing protein n=1 Tax=Gilvimarinus sp. 1_MG-2023 TaxID=3062638 RepID=UPI0026E44A84|nr:DUF488 family protein [Gilvimarinus sp. 1_MG-2023]MDO6748039.1 DUF488 family protein [Gilvimarinus sp. 1_MG-2023]